MDIQYHEVNLDMWISSTLWKELVLLNQIAQFHVEIKLRGAKHQTPSIQLHGHFVRKLIKKILYTHWERWKSCKNIYASTSKFFLIYCFGWNWFAHCNNNTLSLGTWQNWLQSLVSNSFTTKTITYRYTHKEVYCTMKCKHLVSIKILRHVIKFKCSHMNIGI